MKTTALEWNAFMRGDIVDKNAKSAAGTIAQSAFGVHVMIASPQAVFASAGAGASAWANIFSTVLSIADWTCVGVIVFAGATWMFGNRTKAIELLLGGAIGYLIIRHAEDIRNWLRSI